jgi:prepilin-type N-terminal cleavage/methylation domain-containing protein
MKIDSFSRNSSRAGFTLPEVMVSATMLLVVLTGLLCLVTAAATEQQLATTGMTADRESDLVQDQITDVLRQTPNASFVQFADPWDSDGAMFTRVILRPENTELSPDEIYFDRHDGALKYKLGQKESPEILYSARHGFHLAKAIFYPALQRLSMSDSSVINVVVDLEPDDRAHQPDSHPIASRYFSIQLRNNKN